MNDTQMLDWLQEHAVHFSMSVCETYSLEWLDKCGFHQRTIGASLRDCVRGAITAEELKS